MQSGREVLVGREPRGNRDFDVAMRHELGLDARQPDAGLDQAEQHDGGEHRQERQSGLGTAGKITEPHPDDLTMIAPWPSRSAMVLVAEIGWDGIECPVRRTNTYIVAEHVGKTLRGGYNRRASGPQPCRLKLSSSISCTPRSVLP